MASIVLVIVIASFAVAGFLLFGGEPTDSADEFPWITSDHAAEPGMLDGTFYTDEKNEYSTISYKIAGEITVGPEGEGYFKIESSGRNNCLIKVKILVNEETVYETGYLKPNEHISKDILDKIPEIGTYDAKAIFEGFDPNTEESIGKVEANLKITVIP